MFKIRFVDLKDMYIVCYVPIFFVSWIVKKERWILILIWGYIGLIQTKIKFISNF
jgi:hypothetical protein